MSIYVNTIQSIFEGLDTAYTLTQCKVEEDVQRLSHRLLRPSFIQTIEVYTAFNHIQKIFETLNSLPFRSFGVIRNSCLILPSVFAFAANRLQKESHPLVRRMFCLIHDHIGTLSHLSTLVTSIALIALGNFALGATTIAVLGLGFLSRFRIIPHPARNSLENSSYLITSTARLILGGAIGKTLAVSEIILNVTNLLRDVKQKEMLKHVVNEFSQSGPILAETLTLKDVEVNRDHQLYSEYYVPEAQNVKLIELNTLAQQVNWKKYQADFEKRCTNDEHLIGFLKRNFSINPQNNSFENVLHSYVDLVQMRKGLPESYEMIFSYGIERLIESISKRRFQGSEPKEYQPIEDKMKHIITRLAEVNEDKKTTMLFKLALSTYSYSGETIWAIDEIYAELQSETSLKQHLYYQLQKVRDDIFDDVFQKIIDLKKTQNYLKKWSVTKHLSLLFEDVYNPKDRQMAYYYMKLLAQNYGLTHALGARSDRMAMSEAIYELPHYFWHYSSAQEIRNRYKVELIFKKAKDSLSVDQIKEMSSLFSEESIHDGEIKDHQLIAYLVSIGVFKKKLNISNS